MGEYLKIIRDSLERGHRFVTHDIWEIGRPGEQLPSGIIIKNIRVAILLLRGITEETLLLRASALTFATMLCIVPFMVFIFAFIQTFDLGDQFYVNLSQKLNAQIESAIEALHIKDEAEESTAEEEMASEGETEGEGATSTVALNETDTASPVEKLPAVEDAESAATAKMDVETSKKRLWENFIHSMFPSFEEGIEDPEAAAEFQDPVDMLVGIVESNAMDVKTLGITGLMYIFITVFGFMRNVEWSFNSIWGVKHPRSILRTLKDYILITLLLPFMVAGVLGVMAALAALDVPPPFDSILRGGQLVMVWLTFSLLYYLVPNTEVQIRYALLGGIIAGTLWVALSWGYVQFQVGLSRYTFFFSTFALFPMFLFWIYSSWIVLLYGALLAFAYQNEKTFAMERLADKASIAYRESLAVRALVEMTRRFLNGQPGYTLAEMGESWNVPTRLLNEMLDCLIDAKLVTACATEPTSYQPGRAPEKTSVLEVLNAIRERGKDPSLLREDTAYKPLYRALDKADPEYLGTSISDLATYLDKQPPEPPREATPVPSQV